ncbi:MAG: hypothetical protein H7175_00865, partial [Burkholderiales bacterium]|nr:hypothetical protein [Anaerolineae bacterium]
MNLFTKSLAEGISTRILAGILTFVGIMMVVGWVAINEGGRMVAFEQRFEARAIERGAGLFANNCSTCHGIDGRGLEDRAPGLNNPQFFGHDFFPEISGELSGLRPVALDLDALPRERDILLGIVAPAEATDAEAADDDTISEASGEEPIAADTEAEAASEEAAIAEAQADAADEIQPQSGTTGTSSIGTQPIDAVEGETTEAAAESVSDDELSETDAARIAEINVRLDEIAAQYGDGDLAAATSEVTARITELETQRNSQIQPAIDNGYNPDEPDRLGVVGWVSSLDQYIHTTLIHGRPGSENYWDSGLGMAAWGQIGGGPLRDDQLKDLGEYIQNYERDWTLEDLLAVNQFGIVPLNPDGVVLGEP